MTENEVAEVGHGLYVLNWKGGGYSLAAVGTNANGLRWYAPTNWIGVPSFDWEPVHSVIRLCWREWVERERVIMLTSVPDDPDTAAALDWAGAGPTPEQLAACGWEPERSEQG